MPLLFYFPLIIWMGMMEIAQDEMRVPVNVRRERRHGVRWRTILAQAAGVTRVRA